MRRRENGEKRMRGYVKLGEEEGKETHVKRGRKEKDDRTGKKRWRQKMMEERRRRGGKDGRTGKRWRKQKRAKREAGKRKGLDERKDMEDTKRVEEKREEGKKRMMRIQIEIKIGWRRRGE